LRCDISIRRFLPPLSRGCGLVDHRHLPTLTSDSSPNVYSQHSTDNLETGGCSRLLHLEPLPPSRCPYGLSGLTARRRCVTSDLTRPVVAIFTCSPFEIHASLADLGLASCRVVTDLTPNFAFPPVPDSHLSCDRSCWAPKARPLLTSRPSIL